MGTPPPSDFSFMKTGDDVVETTDDLDRDGDDILREANALMLVFAEEAARTAAKYVLSCGRTEVTDLDMKKGLMYQARMFRQEVSDLNTRMQEVGEALDEWMNEDHDGDERSGEENVEDGGEDGEEYGEAEADDEDEGEEYEDDEEFEADPQFVLRVDAIAKSWDKFQPSDPIMKIVKNAIDNTR